MTTYALGGWTFGVNLQDLLNRSKTLARIQGYQHLGADTTEQTTRVAEFVREAVWRVILENPALGLATTTISVVASTQSYAVPTTMQGCLIERVWYSDSGSEAEMDCQTIKFLSRAQVASLPVTFLNGEETDDHPQYCSFNDTGSSIVFYPMPSAAHTVNVTFQAKETTITAANVASPSAVTVSELPTLGMEAVAHLVGGKMADGINQDRSDELIAKFENDLLPRLQRALTRTLAMGRADNPMAESMGPLNTARVFGEMINEL